MALVLKDRVKETSTTTGTGTFTLAGASTGYQAFSAIGNGNTTYYVITDPATGDWEVGLGTYTSSGTTLSRTTVLSSSNAGSLVDFAAGTKEVFCAYPAEKAVYEEANGETLIDGGPITVVGSGVTSLPALPAELGKFVGNANLFTQIYCMNQNTGSSASADFVGYNDLTTDGYTNFIDMGINSSNYTSVDYPIFTPGSGYLFHDGDHLFIGTATTSKDVVIFTGGVDTPNEAMRILGTDQSVELVGDLSVGGALAVTGAATFGSTVLLNQDPTLALQAATKQYVDQIASAGLHIHTPVLVETTGNLTATYVQGGTTFNITDITGGNTVTTSTTHGLAVNDQIWLYSTAGNGLSTNTPYYVYSTPSGTQLTLSLTYGGAQLSGLTNAAGLTYATRANSGVGATLTNAGAQAALTIDNVALSLNDRVMVRLQTTGYENGVYYVSTVGSGATNWVLTRATDSNKVAPEEPNGVGEGDYYYTQDGDINAGDSHVLTTANAGLIIGYTTLTYTQFSGAVTYTGGTNIDITGQTISLTGTVAATNGGTGTSTVTTGDLLYGSGTNTWGKLAAGSAYRALVMNSGGTQVEWNAIALNQANAVSGTLPATYGGTGLSTYTLGDTIYSSATNTLSKLAGNTTTTPKYMRQVGTGSVSQAPTWDTLAASDIASGTLAVARGGTNIGSYTTGDLLYASGTTTLATLADAATGNVLLSGGAGVAPSYGKVVFGTHTSGTNSVSQGGTGATTLTGYVYGNGTGAMTASTTIPNSATTATNLNTASAIVARDASGNFTAGTITAALSGNASTATTLQTARLINGVSFNGSANITVTASTPAALTAGSYLTSDGTFDGSTARTFAVDATALNTASKVVARDGSGNFAAGTVTVTALSGGTVSATTGTFSTSATVNAAAAYFYANRNSSASGEAGIQIQQGGVTQWWMYMPANSSDIRWYNNSGADRMTLTAAGALTATSFSGSGASLTSLNASNLSSGTVATARLASGTANSSTYLRGDQTWASISVTPATVSDQNNTSTGYFDLPVGTTAQRPGTPTVGMMRYNSTESQYEVYSGSAWVTITTAGYSYSVEYLIVAGGAGGASHGGGGAGGMVSGSTTVTGASAYSITVGGGGAGNFSGTGSSGSTSSGFSVSSTGGGGGGGQTNGGANPGGSGGGASAVGAGTYSGAAGTPGQGNSGGSASSFPGAGNCGGGGGGKGASGGNGQTSPNRGGNGGGGSAWSDGVTYAGGGGGGCAIGGGINSSGGSGGGGAGSASGPGTSGTANTGGGGGGTGGSGSGGSGGAGVVIIRYAGSQRGSGGTVTSAGGYTYHTFTTSGTYTA